MVKLFFVTVQCLSAWPNKNSEIYFNKNLFKFLAYLFFCVRLPLILVWLANTNLSLEFLSYRSWWNFCDLNSLDAISKDTEFCVNCVTELAPICVCIYVSVLKLLALCKLLCD